MSKESLPQLCTDLLLFLESKRGGTSRIATDAETVQRFDAAIKALGDPDLLLKQARQLMSLERRKTELSRKATDLKGELAKRTDKKSRDAYRRAQHAHREAFEKLADFEAELSPSSEIVRSVARGLSERPKGTSEAEEVGGLIEHIRADLERRKTGYFGLPEKFQADAVEACVGRGLVERYWPAHVGLTQLGRAAIAESRLTPAKVDESAYVLASKLRRQAGLTLPKFKTILANNPQIRRQQGTNRLNVHAGDWTTYWAKQSGDAFDALDRKPRRSLTGEASYLEGAAQRLAEIRAKKAAGKPGKSPH